MIYIYVMVRCGIAGPFRNGRNVHFWAMYEGKLGENRVFYILYITKAQSSLRVIP